MVWRCFKAEGKSPHPFFLIIQTSFPICSILALTKSSLSPAPFPLFPFLPHTAILPLRWRDVVSKTPVVCQQTVSKLLNRWMTELRVWVLARCVQAVQEQEAPGGENNKDFNVSHLTSVSVTLCRTTSNSMLQWIIDFPTFFFFFVFNQMSNVKSQLRKKRSILTQGSSPSLENGVPPVNLSSRQQMYQWIKGPPSKKLNKKIQAWLLWGKKKSPPSGVFPLTLPLCTCTESLKSSICLRVQWRQCIASGTSFQLRATSLQRTGEENCQH